MISPKASPGEKVLLYLTRVDVYSLVPPFLQ